MCCEAMGKDTEKNSAQRLFAGLFLFEVYYCPMLFSKNIINIRKTLSLFGILHSRKNINIEPKKASLG